MAWPGGLPPLDLLATQRIVLLRRAEAQTPSTLPTFRARHGAAFPIGEALNGPL